MWTVDKEGKLIELIRERNRVEASAELLKVWNLSESWFTVLMKNMTDDEKQSLLDSLLTARRPVIEKAIIDKQAEVNNLNALLTAEDDLKK